MAGRSVGSIEVQVEADTGKLKAQLVKDGTVAGAEAKKAIEKELRNVEAELGLNSTRARAELREFKKAVDRIDADIEIGFDEKSMQDDLARVQAEIEAVQADLELALDKNSVALVRSELKEIQAGYDQTLEFQLVVDPKYKAQFDAQLRYYENRRLELEAKLDLDEHTLQMKLERLEQEERDLQFGLEFAPKARAMLEAQLKRIEVEDRTIEMEVLLNEKKALAQLRTLENQKVKLGLDTATATAEFQSWQARLEAQKLLAEVDGDFTDFNLSIKELRAKLALESFDVQIKADTAKAVADIKVLQTQLEHKSINFKTEADIARARATLVAFREVQEANDIEIPVNVDLDAMDAALTKMQERLAKGEEAGGGGGGFISSLPIKYKIAFGAIVGLADEAATAITDGLAAATSVVSSAFSAAAGSGGAFVGVMAAMGGMATTLIVGFQGMGDALGAINEEFTASIAEGRAFNMQAEDITAAMAGLAPAAQDTARAFAELLPSLSAIRSIVQQNLFANMDLSVRGLGAQLPAVSSGLADIASSLNNLFRGLTARFTDMDIAGIFDGLQPVVDNIVDAFLNLADVVEPFLKSAAPAAKELSKWFADGAKGLAEMTEAGQKSGGLALFLLEGVESLKEWVGLLGNVGDLLFTVFDAGKESGDSFVSSLSDLVKKWDEWLEGLEGQEALQDFFEGGKQLLQDLKPLLAGVKEAFETLISPEAEASFGELARGLGELLPFLAELINLISRVGITNVLVDAMVAVSDAITPILPQLRELADALGASLSGAVAAITPLLGAAATAIGFLADVLTPLAPAIAGIATAFLAWKAISSIVSAVQGALSGLSGPMLAIGAAVGIAMFAIQAFGAEEAEMNARASEVAGTLETQVNALLETATAGTTAALGVRALSKALAEAGGDGEKLTESLGTLGKTTDDSLSVLQSFGKNGETASEALRELAESAGLSGAGVDELVRKIAESDEPYLDVSEANRRLAEQLGITQAELKRIGSAMEEVQDQAEKTNINKVTQEFLASSAASSQLNSDLLKQAESLTGVSRTADDVSGLYVTYTSLLAKNAVEANATEAATAALAKAQANAVGEITAADKALLEQAKSMDKLKQAMGKVDITALHEGANFAAKEWAKLTAEFDKSAEAADAMTDAFDKLVGRNLNVDEAVSNVQQSLADMNETMKENDGFAKQTATNFDLTTQAGRDVAESIRGGITAISDWGSAALASGTSSEDAAAMMEAMRGKLVDTASQFFTTRQEADAYIRNLGLTPQNIQTFVSTPGLIEAMAQISGYDSDLDGIPDNVDVEFNLPNVDVIREQLKGFGVNVDEIPDDVLISFFTENAKVATDQVDEFGTKVGDVKDVTAEATISAPGAVDATGEVADFDETIGVLPDSAPVPVSAPGATEATTQIDAVKAAEDKLYDKSVKVTVDGAVLGKQQVDALRESIRLLQDKTITVRTNNVSTTTNGMSGALITGPRNMNVGELGYTEALVPLQLPLNRVDPSVRDLAALIRGDGPSRATPDPSGKVVNNFMTITPQSADPVAVATQVINRSAVLANRN